MTAGRHRMTRGRLAWALTIVVSVVYAFGFLATPTADAGPGLLLGLGMTSFLVVGAMLISRVPGNRIGSLFVIAGLLVLFSAVGSGIATADAGQTLLTPAATTIDAIANDALIFAIAVALIGVPLIFPDGHLPSARFRWIVWLTVICMTTSVMTDVLWALVAGAPDLGNIPVVAWLATALLVIAGPVALASVLAFGGAAAAVWVRYRRGSPIVRQQTKWLMVAAGVATVAFPVSFSLSHFTTLDGLNAFFFLIGVLALVALPWAVAIAVLRYHLYDIDRIVSRTIAYAVVTGILAVVFSGAILLLSSILSDVAQGQTVAVAASTLVVFALFQPIRRQVQGIVDRRFDRARYDAARTAASFAERLRNETDMETVTKDLAWTTTLTVAPTSLGIWLRTKGVSR